MSLPIIMLSGSAGCGKDTVAGFIAKNHRAAVIAQADPMKRFARDVFGYTEHQLWGPSALRNAPVDLPAFMNLRHRFWETAEGWVAEVLPQLSDAHHYRAVELLAEWLVRFDRDQRDSIECAPREVLQTLGTEWGRSFSRQMWIEYALRTAKKLLLGGYSYSRTAGLIEDPAKPGFDHVVITDGRFRNELLAVREAGGKTVKIECPGAGLTGAAAQHSSETELATIPEHFFTGVLHNCKADGLDDLEKTTAELIWRIQDDTWTVGTSTWVSQT